MHKFNLCLPMAIKILNKIFRIPQRIKRFSAQICKNTRYMYFRSEQITLCNVSSFQQEPTSDTPRLSICAVVLKLN